MPKSSDLVMDSMKMALAIVVTLKEHNIDAKVKWPNDVYVGDKKIAGILVENTFSGSDLKFSVTGVGLNVNQETFNESMAVSMRNITGLSYDLLSLSHDLLESIKKVRLQSEKSSLYMINSHLYRKNEEVDFEHNGAIENYTVKRICENGKLGVERNGESKELEFHRIKWVKGSLA
ncbi:hypothetical protein GYB22_13045 [bacterium]|nr:hypothetical protein [bacterium]